MGRLQREYSTTGYYHIMLRGNERKKIFINDEDRQRFIEILAKKKNETGYSLYSYCLMDNHVHLVIRDDEKEISNIMKGIATGYAMFFNNKYNRVGHVFQDRFKSEPIENEKYLMAAIRYVHNNPIKAGMVEKHEQYKWSSYQCYLTPTQPESKLIDTGFILGMISNDQKEAIRQFKWFSIENDETEYIDEEEGKVRTLEEGKTYLEEKLKKTWPGRSREDLLKNKEIRNEIIADLRTNTRLSIRKIAELLGVNRGIVQEVRPKPKG